MTGAQQHRPHREAGNLPRIPMRPSRFVLAALVVFIAIAGAAVFECIAGHFGAFDGTVAALVVAALLGVAASRWRRRQPAAIALHADGLTVWDRAGGAQYFSIIGCAQWGGRLLALTLSSGKTGRARCSSPPMPSIPTPSASLQCAPAAPRAHTCNDCNGA